MEDSYSPCLVSDACQPLANPSMEALRASRCRLESGDVGYAWLQRRNSQWQRLQAHSERALHALAASKERASDSVPLCGGRWEANLKLWDDVSGHSGLGVVGSLTSRYGEGPPVPLARTRWCYRRGGGKWMPFAAAQDASLEETFRALQVSAATKAAVVAQDGGLAQKVVSSVVDVTAADNEAYKVCNCNANSRRANRDVTLGPAASQVTLECDVRSASVGAWMKLANGGWMARPCSVSRGWAGEALPPLADEELAVEQARGSGGSRCRRASVRWDRGRGREARDWGQGREARRPDLLTWPADSAGGVDLLICLPV